MGGSTELRTFTSDELAFFDGIRHSRIFLALQGRIYDVTERPDLYSGKGGYAILAGQDATRSLTKMSLKREDVGRSDLDDLFRNENAELHRKALADWVAKFEKTYEVVGVLEPSRPWSPVRSFCQHVQMLWKPSQCPLKTPLIDGRDSSSSVLPPMEQLPTHLPHTPEKLELLCAKPRVYRIRSFLSAGECQALRGMALKQATPETGMVIKDEKVRALLGMNDQRWNGNQRQMLASIEDRIAEVLGCGPHQDEIDLVGCLTPPSANLENSGPRCHIGLHVDTNGNRPWRYATAICYLSTVDRGGATAFPLAVQQDLGGPPSDEHMEVLEGAQRLLDQGIDHTDRVLVREECLDLKPEVDKLVQTCDEGSGLNVAPEEGTAVFFWTRRDDGEIDPHSWHGGETVLKGCKWTLQKFKEVPAHARGPGEIADFVRKSRRCCSA